MVWRSTGVRAAARSTVGGRRRAELDYGAGEPLPAADLPLGPGFQRRSRRPLQSESGLVDVDQHRHQHSELDAGNTSVWFDVSPTNGTLLPGGAAASVSVSVDASAGTFPAGVYAATLAFTNQTSGVTQSCALVLSVAASSMADDFDPGIDLSQWSSFGGVVGSTVLATNYGGSVSASNSLWFGNAGSRYATTIPINTSGGGQIGFCIRLANGLAWPWASGE